jgi:hypothetical protein
MPFVNSQMGGMSFAFPDICLTPIPTPVGPIPVPIPYPNFSTGITAMPFTAAFKVLIMAMPAHNLGTIGTLSMGDFPGVMMGIMSGMVMGPDRAFLGSFKTLMGGLPVSKLLSMTGQNGLSPNMIGLRIVPSQFKVLALT